ncbi:MAG: response regulator [Actinomycetota bacterium]
MIKLFLVDDHEMMRLGLRQALSKERDITVVGEAAGFDEALVSLGSLEADVALLDVRLPERSGIELCREVVDQKPGLRCLIYTSAPGDGPLQEAILAGASGYLLKDAPREELVEAIRRVADGQSLIDPAVTARLMSRLREGSSDPVAHLTEQERNVLDLVGEGLTNREIAEQLFLAEQTVKNYVSRVLVKLDMRRTQAALFAAQRRSSAESL